MNRLGIFVGRQSETEELTSLLDKSLTGIFSCALVVGEAGIGKTRLVQEFADRARDQGTTVLTGTCIENQETSSYGPWREALSRFTRTASGASIPSPTGAGGQKLATLVPELSEHLSEEYTGQNETGSADRRELMFTH